MMENGKDNKINFGEEIASLYEATRPFIPPGEKSKCIDRLCHMIIDRFKGGPGLVRLLDAGAGTGRISEYIARQYTEISLSRAGAPKLEITCLDCSQEMLNRCKEKATKFQGGPVCLVPLEKDMRDLSATDGKFDVAIAHWVFHVMSDWRIAVYALDQALTTDALVFQFDETSQLYEAIDGNFDGLEDNKIRGFWTEFQAKRSVIVSELSSAGQFTTPRQRLGSYVVDKRINHMFSILGWDEPRKLCDGDTWSHEFTVGEIIDNVVRKRGFTNTRIFPDDNEAKSRFSELANKLEEKLPEWGIDINYPWDLKFKLEGLLLQRKKTQEPSNAAGNLIAVARDTVGWRWRYRLGHTYNRKSLWVRLFKTTWHRMNHDSNGICGPLLGTGFQNIEPIKGIYVNAPFLGLREPLNAMVPSKDAPSQLKDNVRAIWNQLTHYLESYDPFILIFSANVPNPEKKNVSQTRLHPSVQKIVIEGEVYQELLKIPEDGLCPLAMEIDGIASNWTPARTAVLKSMALPSVRELIQRDVVAPGILPFNETAKREFLLGVASLLKGDCIDSTKNPRISTVYVFAIPVRITASKPSTFGLMVASQGELSDEVIDFLWSYVDLIFNEYIEDYLFFSPITTDNQSNNGESLTVEAPKRSFLVIATEWFSRHGGLSTFNRNLCIELAAMGHEVVCAVPKILDGESDSASGNKVTLIEARKGQLNRRLDLTYGFYPDVVLGHDHHTGSAAQAQLSDSFVKAIRVHVIHTAQSSELEFIKKVYSKNNISSATEKAERKRTAQVDLASTAQLVVGVGPLLYNEISTELSGQTHQPRCFRFDPGIRKNLAVSRDPQSVFNCLVLGRTEDMEVKGLDIAAKAVGMITHGKVRLIIRGADVKEGDSLRDKLKKLMPNGCHEIITRPYDSNIEKLESDLRTASLLLMPSRVEGFGLVALEALEVGTPILVSHKSGVAKVIEEHAKDLASLFVVPVTGELDTDAGAWSEAISRVINDQKSAFKNTDRLFDELSPHLNWEKSVRGLMREIEATINP